MKREKSCGCIIIKGNRVLLVGSRDNDGKLYWSFPKGHQEEGETDIETAIRETKEEVGLDVKIINETPIKTEYLVHDGTVHKDVLLFIAEPLNDEIKKQEDEIEKAEWVKIDEATSRFGKYYSDVWAELLRIFRYNGGVNQESKGTSRTGWKIVGVVFAVLATVLVALVIINRVTVRDFLRGMNYQPTAEMAEIRDKLQLTDWGKFVFNASQPELNERDDFNINCYSMDEETAVLGCYTNENIYVYNIKEQKLDGIRELTAAHELLHAIYVRLSKEEKADLEPILRRVYQENLDVLDKDVKQYLQGEQLEEIYVRAGTEVKELPEVLETHYAKVFSNQDAVVSFYEKYISVFRELETKLDNLEKEMAEIRAVMDEKTASYENRTTEFAAKVNEFNNCANTAGCFNSAWEFYMQRNQLVMEQESLAILYNEISDLLNQYNTRVDEYNDNVIKSNRLNQIINSNQKVEAID